MEKCIITIARRYGSGGKQIGKLLAKELGIDCYDREILRMASDDSGINEELFGKADETNKKGLLYSVAKKIYKGELIGPDSDDFTSDENLFNYQAKIIKELADKESCVIIGRCADFILKERKDVIRVFTYSSMEQSLKNIHEVQGLDEKAAKQLIAKRDKYRSDYYKYHTGQDWERMQNYDLCLNTDHLTFEEGAQMIKDYIALRNGGRHE